MNVEAIKAISQKTIDVIHKDRPEVPVLTHYWTDVLHDVLELSRENAPESFIWCVRESGTRLFSLPLSNLSYTKGALHYAHSALDQALWFIYDKENGLTQVTRQHIHERFLSD